MPVLVVGADTGLGKAAVAALAPTASEIRAFATDPDVADELRHHGAAVAIGDVSDASHLAGAALGAFSAVLVTEAAADDRDRAFADSPREVYDAWVEALRDAGVRRVIWVGSDPPAELEDLDVELATVDPAVGTTKAVENIVAIDDAADIG